MTPILAPPERPGTRPTGVPAVKLGCRPGTGRIVLDQLRAADRPRRYTPSDLLFGVPLRNVALVSVEENAAAILAGLDAAPGIRHEPEVAAALARVAAMLAEVTV